MKPFSIENRGILRLLQQEIGSCDGNQGQCVVELGILADNNPEFAHDFGKFLRSGCTLELKRLWSKVVLLLDANFPRQHTKTVKCACCGHERAVTIAREIRDPLDCTLYGTTWEAIDSGFMHVMESIT